MKEMIIEKEWGTLTFSFDPVFLDEEYEQEIFDIAKEYVKKDDIVLDIGAHQGIYTTLFSSLIGENGKVYAFEPHPTNFKYLQKNSSENIIPIMKAIGSYNGEATLRIFNRYGTTGHGFKVGDIPDETLVVEMITIDSFVKQNNIDKLDFIKIDVEHWEIEVLKGALETINRFKPKMIIEVHGIENLKLIHEFCYIAKLGHKEIQPTKGLNKNLFFLIGGG